MKPFISKSNWIQQKTIQKFFIEMQMSRRLRLFAELTNRKLRRANFKGAGSHPAIQTGIALCILIGALLFARSIAPAASGNVAAFAKGPIGTFTLTLGGVTIRPLTAVLTDQPHVCLALIAAEMDGQAFEVPENGVFLMGNQRVYPAISVTSIGQDTLFGQQKIRAFAFNPSALCGHGGIKIEDLALLLIRPVGTGVVSFTNPQTASSTK